MPEDSRFYNYRPIDFQHRGFRVAILQPSLDSSALICCDLVEVSLNDNPAYEVISYVWGDPQDQAPLRVEGEELRVTVNLELALRYLRLPDEPRRLWADAICIDQNNIEERNQQVQLMKDIYSSCTRDLVWLGESSIHTESGIACLTRMKSLNLHRLTDRGGKSFNDKVAVRDLGAGNAYAIKHIISYPSLWSRVWVMQEIACCPEALLVIGHYTMPWTILSSILDHSGIPDRYHLPFSHQRFEEDIWDAFAKTQVIEHQRDIIKGVSPLNSTLLDVLSRFRATYSTDPRDKIYGLLGLATDNLGIVPDYKKSVRDVYVEVTQAQLNATRNLDLITQSLWPLGNTGIKDSDSCLDLDLPSWVPNFSATKAEKILFAQRSIFAAGAATFISQQVAMTPAGVLNISGTMLAAVKTLKPVRKMIYSGGQYFSPWARDWLPDSLASGSDNSTYPTGCDAFEAYWRTLMTDCIAFPSRRLLESDLKEYANLFNDWRVKIAALPYNDMTEHPDKYDGDEELLYAMGNAAQKAGMSELIRKWRFAELEGGLYSMVPWEETTREPEHSAKVGDVVVVVGGGKVPIVLREKGNNEGNGKWEVIGTAYVHGFMDGLATGWVKEGRLKERTFDIVYRSSSNCGTSTSYTSLTTAICHFFTKLGCH